MNEQFLFSAFAALAAVFVAPAAERRLLLANAKFTPEEMAKILFAPCAWGHQPPKKP